MFTKQETFDIVAKHLLTQNEQARAMVANSTMVMIEGCAYRGKNGTKCAAGCLIPDELYSPKIEGKCSTHSDVKELLKDHNTMLVSSLQNIHDTYSVESWKKKLQQLAADNYLEFKF